MDVAQKRNVNWGLVIAGLLIAWVSGAVVGVVAAIASIGFFSGKAVLAGVVVAVVVGLLYFAIYWFTRRPAPDLAIGVLIGGCMVALISGACGALMSGLQNMH